MEDRHPFCRAMQQIRQHSTASNGGGGAKVAIRVEIAVGCSREYGGSGNGCRRGCGHCSDAGACLPRVRRLISASRARSRRPQTRTCQPCSRTRLTDHYTISFDSGVTRPVVQVAEDVAVGLGLIYYASPFEELRKALDAPPHDQMLWEEVPESIITILTTAPIGLYSVNKKAHSELPDIHVCVR